MIYVKDIIDKFNGKLLCGDINLVLDNFSHDTRTIQEGDIYVGIKGESFDGNRFYKDALEKGAKACILDNIDGIGEVRKNKLLKKYKTITKMKEASTEDLEEILPRDTAVKFKEFLDSYE